VTYVVYGYYYCYYCGRRIEMEDRLPAAAAAAKEAVDLLWL
jgi:hypothetical protein